jgi:hypothetical protein
VEYQYLRITKNRAKFLKRSVKDIYVSIDRTGGEGIINKGFSSEFDERSSYKKFEAFFAFFFKPATSTVNLREA